MRISKKGELYIAECTFNEKDIPKTAGFKWYKKDKYWWTNDPENVKKIIEFADDEIKEELDAYSERKKDLIEKSRKESSDIEIPAPDKLSYRPYQKAGVEYVMEVHNAIIADSMGVGKTIQAIGVHNLIKSNKTLVIVPASLKINWYNEFEKWNVYDQSIGIAEGNNLPDKNIVIISYALVAKNRKNIDNYAWDLMICDESHKLKNPSSRQTSIFFLFLATKA